MIALLLRTAFALKGQTGCIPVPIKRKELTVEWITKEKRDKVKPGKYQQIYVRNITPASVLIVCGSGSCLTIRTRALSDFFGSNIFG